jgi:murein DD-endopeptidase MepM/ murein hydrolase activator NlpD
MTSKSGSEFNSKMLRRLIFLTILAGFFLWAVPVSAQTPTSGPVYIVQPGDYLSTIAARFNVSLADLMTVNNLSNPNLLAAGQQLIIPGLDGVTGVLDTEVVNFGDSFRSFVRRTQIPVNLLTRLNHFVSPSEFYVGASMVVLKQSNSAELTNRITPSPSESLLELAISSKTDPWTLTMLNSLGGRWDALPGDVLYAPGNAAGNQGASGLPSAFLSAELPTLPLKQGGTAEIIVKPASNVALGGMLATYPLHFFPIGDGRMVALQGIHALLSPGVYPLRLDATYSDGTKQSFDQSVLISSGNYPKEALLVSNELIDPAVTGPEDQQMGSLTSPATSEKYWQGVFDLPVYVTKGALPFIYDRFGTRRSFNGSDYIYFHSGIDYGVELVHPFDIYAAAPGKVIFAGPLTVRGNATIIDHGWGVYTGYYHQKEIDVAVGQQVQAGQLIGQIGATGRVTGPHLHFEIWVNGIQVNPVEWLNRTFP